MEGRAEDGGRREENKMEGKKKKKRNSRKEEGGKTEEEAQEEGCTCPSFPAVAVHQNITGQFNIVDNLFHHVTKANVKKKSLLILEYEKIQKFGSLDDRKMQNRKVETKGQK
jgi:hypothetical protein